MRLSIPRIKQFKIAGANVEIVISLDGDDELHCQYIGNPKALPAQLIAEEARETYYRFRREAVTDWGMAGLPGVLTL